jgi:hypothetical protein
MNQAQNLKRAPSWGSSSSDSCAGDVKGQPLGIPLQTCHHGSILEEMSSSDDEMGNLLRKKLSKNNRVFHRTPPSNEGRRPSSHGNGKGAHSFDASEYGGTRPPPEAILSKSQPEHCISGSKGFVVRQKQ